mgnify:CR=1 FL=1
MSGAGPPVRVLVRKRYVDLPHGQVHLRVGGSGPPVVLLHDSPRSSLMHRDHVAWFGQRFTVYALDTPGYGNSTPLPADPAPSIPDFAAALETCLLALGLRAPALYGFHTSSKIALALATRPQAPLGGAVLDGLSLPAALPPEDFIQSYMLPFEVREDGSHLVTQWSKVLDFHRWFPWFSRTARTRLAMELPGDEALHAYALDTMMAGSSWSSAYAAAMRYAAREAFDGIRRPLTFTCRADDVLFGFLDSLPEPLPAGCRRVPLGSDREGWRERLAAWFHDYAGHEEPPPVPDPLDAPGPALRRGYVDLDAGQVHLRVAGVGARPPLLLLHDVPGSAAAVEALGVALATDRRVLLPDLPGSGESDPLAVPDAAGYASALLACLDRLSLDTVDVYAEHLAAPLALELATRAPARVRRLVCDGLPPPDPAERAALLPDYCPSLAPRRDGAFWLTAWHLLGDREACWPWFARGREAVRRRGPALDAATRHRLVVDLMKQPDRYAEPVAAALSVAMDEGLAATGARLIVLQDAADPRDAGAASALRLAPGARLAARPSSAGELPAVLRRLLDA